MMRGLAGRNRAKQVSLEPSTLYLVTREKIEATSR